MIDLVADWLGHQRWAARAADERNLVEEWFGRKPEPSPESHNSERLLALQKQIERVKAEGDRGDPTGERLLELRRQHHRANGASGG